MSLNIIQKPSPNFGSRKGYKPEIIVIHIMSGSLKGTDSWFATSASQVSSHYGVGLKGEIHQYVAEENAAWTQGLKIPPVNKPLFKLYKPGLNPNVYCLSIEHEGNDLAKCTQAQFDASVELIRTITAKYGIVPSRDTIIGHYEIDPVRKPHCSSKDKTILDKLVNAVKGEEIVTITVKKSLVERVLQFIKTLK